MNSHSLATSLLSAVPKIMRSVRADLRISTTELTLTQYRVLARLHEEPRLNSELAVLLGVSVPVMTRHVQSMVRLKWIGCVVLKNDRRKTALRITPAGEKIFGRVHGILVEHFAERIETLDERSKQELEKGLLVLVRLAEMKSASLGLRVEKKKSPFPSEKGGVA